ncbi:hypothetical protein E3J79_03290 [Candidatus Dependentiae bacterium]|nr:MAG: hypothetical protein E3J79_03290 [Candidatus Dependentiae bacterium]
MLKFLILFLLSATVLIQAGYDNPRKLRTKKEKLRQLKQLTGKSSSVALEYLEKSNDFYLEPKKPETRKSTLICREN